MKKKAERLKMVENPHHKISKKLRKAGEGKMEKKVERPSGGHYGEAHREISKKLRQAKALVTEAYRLVRYTYDGPTNIDSYYERGRELNHQIIKNIDLWRGVMDELVHAQGEYFEYTWGELKDIYFPCEECEKTHLQKANK